MVNNEFYKFFIHIKFLSILVFVNITKTPNYVLPNVSLPINTKQIQQHCENFEKIRINQILVEVDLRN